MPSVDGIASGLDTTSLISGLIEAASVPKLQLEVQLEGYEDKKEALAGLQNRMQDLFDTLDGLVDTDDLYPSTATAASEDQFLVTADGSAVPGAFDVQVHSLATNEIEVSQGYADRSSTGVLPEGTLTVTYGGVDYDITVDSENSSLDDIAEAISSEIDGVEAFVLDTGAATDPYKLVIAGETGAANTLQIDTSGLGGGGTAPAFTEQSTAADAHVTINNVDVYSATDTVDDAIPGVTFDLAAAGTEPVRVSIAKDPDAFEEQVQAVVAAYNEVRAYYDQGLVVNPDAGIRGALVGDSSARRVMESLGDAVTRTYANSGALEALSQIGVRTLQSGKLELDTEAFRDMLDERPDDVEALLSEDTGPLAQLRTDIEDVYLDSDNGLLESRSDSVQSSIDALQERIDAFDVRMEAYEGRLRNRFNAMERAMAELQASQAYLSAVLPQTSVI